MIYLQKITLCGAMISSLLVSSWLFAEEPTDPAEDLIRTELTAKEKETCRALFKELGNDEMEAREKALRDLLAMGPLVLPIAEEFTQDNDAEIAAQANSLRERIFTQYDGYLQTSQKLLDALEKEFSPEEVDVSKGTFLQSLEALAANANFKLKCDPKVTLPEPESGRVDKKSTTTSVKKYLSIYMIEAVMLDKNIDYILRGDTVYITTPETAARLRLQKKTFDWSELSLTRGEAERVGNALRTFFPAADTEVTTSTQVLLVRGEEACIPRAQRLLSLLKPGSRDGLYPISKTDTERLIEVLQKPVSLNLASEDPLDAIAVFAKQNVAIFAVSAMTPPEGVQEKFPSDLQGLAPTKLSLKQLPLGLCLRWLERRSKLITMDQANHKLSYVVGEKNEIQLRLQPKDSSKTALPIVGADVRFLYEKEAESNSETDKEVRKKILSALDSHLALLPDLSDGSDLQVLRGRLLLQGPTVTLRKVLTLIEQWRKSGIPPPPAQWKKELDAALDREIEWNGHDDEDVPLSGRRVIPALRKMGAVNLLLGDASDGSAGVFQLTREDARLLPSGKHTLRALLDDLAKKTGASWQLDLGVITITPQVKAKPK